MTGMRMDMVELLPGSMKTVDMVPDDPGTWLYHCHVNDHIIAGMMALFTVTE
jgi:FtsP/CotA-like multicopper oxidase with cupredoxin domain